MGTRTTVAVGRRGARAIALALLVYGVAGLALIAATGLTAAPAIDTIESLARSSVEVRATLASTRDAFDGFGTSLAEGKSSAESAAASARSSAQAARQLASAMSLSIFGAQPFRPIATGFEKQSADLDALASDLEDLATAIGRNLGDVQEISDGIAVLQTRASTIADSSALASIGQARTLAAALLAWLAVQAVAALAAAIALWRAAATER